MNGPTTLSIFLRKNDPNLFLKELFSMHSKYSKCNDGLMSKIYQWWVEKIKYPYYKYKIYKAQMETVDLLYQDPSLVTPILIRYVQFLLGYCQIQDLTVDEFLYHLFQDGIKINYKSDGNRIVFFSIYIQSLMDKELINTEEDKVATTLIELDLEAYRNKYSQVIFDTSNPFNASTANILQDNHFDLGLDGKLHNPNYILDASLLEEDLQKYRLIISQLMIFLGTVFDEACSLIFYKMEQKSE